MKKSSLWILKPQKTVLIKNKTTKQHNLFSHYNYGLLPWLLRSPLRSSSSGTRAAAHWNRTRRTETASRAFRLCSLGWLPRIWTALCWRSRVAWFCLCSRPISGGQSWGKTAGLFHTNRRLSRTWRRESSFVIGRPRREAAVEWPVHNWRDRTLIFKFIK